VHRLEPQTLEFDQSGAPYSRRYADVYASRDGALGQARHVFLAGNDLPARWAKRLQFTILETGFGLGTNFLATWQAWRDDPQRPQRLHFLSVERHPLRAHDLQSGFLLPRQQDDPGCSEPRHRIAPGAQDASRQDPLGDLRSQLAAQWPLLTAGLHRLEFEEGRVLLTLALGDALELVPQLRPGVDAFYLDGFAPRRNPRMWDPRIFWALARMARSDATVATYTCARSVREALEKNGFAVSRRSGFATKREMLSARFAPRWKLRRHNPPLPYEGQRHAIVVGAGLAGCSTAYALRKRGWSVTLLERAEEAAKEASGLPVGLLRPVLSADDNRASRLMRAGFFFGLSLLHRLAPSGNTRDAEGLWRQCGVFDQASSAQEALATNAQLQEQAWPAEFAVFRDVQQAAAHLGLVPRNGGTWFARGAVVSAARWCGALLDAPGQMDPAAPLLRGFGFEVASVTPADGGWRVTETHGRSYEAPIVVLANAMGMARLCQGQELPIQELAGRITLLAPSALRELRAGVSGDGYLIPPLLGRAAVGATYESVQAQASAFSGTLVGEAADLAALPDAASVHAHRVNLDRLPQLLVDPPRLQADGAFFARRCVCQDHLPLAGALPDTSAIGRDPDRYCGAHLPDLPRLSGLFCLSALGSRGLALAPLLGEHVASLITGEPPPIETALSAAVDPARFLVRRLRGKTAASA